MTAQYSGAGPPSASLVPLFKINRIVKMHKQITTDHHTLDSFADHGELCQHNLFFSASPSGAGGLRARQEARP